MPEGVTGIGVIYDVQGLTVMIKVNYDTCGG